jgi:hypothetical protein
LETEVAVFKEVSKEEFYEIERTIDDFRYFLIRKNNRFSSLDENEVIKQVIGFFERNSTIKGSVGNTTIYAIPLYYYDPPLRSGRALVSFLLIKRDASGYTIEIQYKRTREFEASSNTDAEKRAEEELGAFVKPLAKALSAKSTLAIKLVELLDCAEEARLVNLLYRFYGDEILNDDTIPGLHSLCYGETRFFANDKVIVIPDLHLWVVRDIRGGRIFIRNITLASFSEVEPDEKIFYEALFEAFRAHRDLLELSAIIKDEYGNEYSVSTFDTVVNGKKVILMPILSRSPTSDKWLVDSIFAFTCDIDQEDDCLIYSFRFGYFPRIADITPTGENFLKQILGIKRINERVKKEVAKYLAEKSEWEILPA